MATFFLLAVWAGITGIDYWRTVRTFARPLFAICTHGYDDGGSGIYTGIGYAIHIQGNFMPEDEHPGVTLAEFYLFGNPVAKALRD
jgi:hypothetical protein